MPPPARRVRSTVFICTDCREVSLSKAGLKKHRNTHHAVPMEQAGDATTPVFSNYYHTKLNGMRCCKFRMNAVVQASYFQQGDRVVQRENSCLRALRLHKTNLVKMNMMKLLPGASLSRELGLTLLSTTLSSSSHPRLKLIRPLTCGMLRFSNKVELHHGLVPTRCTLPLIRYRREMRHGNATG
jgi:hypothetical protein